MYKKVISVLILTVLLFTSVGCKSKSNISDIPSDTSSKLPDDEIYKSAINYIIAGNLESAVSELEQIRDINETYGTAFSEVSHNYGVELFNKGDFNKAAKVFAAADLKELRATATFYDSCAQSDFITAYNGLIDVVNMSVDGYSDTAKVYTKSMLQRFMKYSWEYDYSSSKRICFYFADTLVTMIIFDVHPDKSVSVASKGIYAVEYDYDKIFIGDSTTLHIVEPTFITNNHVRLQFNNAEMSQANAVYKKIDLNTNLPLTFDLSLDPPVLSMKKYTFTDDTTVLDSVANIEINKDNNETENDDSANNNEVVNEPLQNEEPHKNKVETSDDDYEIINPPQQTVGTEQIETHYHSFSQATCEKPAVCSCGETYGEALGHQWEEATCEKAKTCISCDKTEGAPLGHKFESSHPFYCTNCNDENPNGLSILQNITVVSVDSKVAIVDYSISDFSLGSMSTPYGKYGYAFTFDYEIECLSDFGTYQMDIVSYDANNNILSDSYSMFNHYSGTLTTGERTQKRHYFVIYSDKPISRIEIG